MWYLARPTARLKGVGSDILPGPLVFGLMTKMSSRVLDLKIELD
jgi:hypothetical protein